MPDDESAATAEGTAQAAPEQAAAPQVDYNALLDQIPEEVMLKHRRVGGFVGGRAQQIAQQQIEQQRQAEWQKAQAEKIAELEREAEENPFAFSQKWLKGRAEERAKLELSELRGRAQKQLFEKVATSYAAIPEWQQLSPEDFGRIQQQVAGKSDEDLVAAFNVAALDILSERRAMSRSDRTMQERLVQERAAWEQEAQARRLRGETTPDMSVPMSAGGISDARAIRGMSDAEFQRFYDSTFRT